MSGRYNEETAVRLGLSREADDGEIEREIHRIFRSTFGTPDGKKALNILLNRLGYFSASYPGESERAREERHILADFAQYMRIELLGACDTIRLTDALIDNA